LTYSYQSSINTHAAFTWDPFKVGSGGRRAYDLETKTWSYKNQQEYGFSEYTLDFMSDRARDYNKHGDLPDIVRNSKLNGKSKGDDTSTWTTIDYSSLVYPHSQKSEIYKYRYCWKQPANCRDIKIDVSLSSMYTRTERGSRRGMPSNHIYYFGRTGTTYGST